MDVGLIVVSVLASLPTWLLHAVGLAGSLWLRSRLQHSGDATTSWPRAGTLAAAAFSVLLALDVLQAVVYAGLDLSTNLLGAQFLGAWAYRALALGFNMGTALAIVALALAATLDRSTDGLA